MCCAQSGLRLFPKLVHTEEGIDLFSALPFSACSAQLRAIDLPCKGQIFFHMLWEEFSINSCDSCCYCCSQIPVGFSSVCVFPPPARACFLCKDKVNLVFIPMTTQSSWAVEWVSQGEEAAGPRRGTNAASLGEPQLWGRNWGRQIQRHKPLNIMWASPCCTQWSTQCVSVSDRHTAVWHQQQRCNEGRALAKRCATLQVTAGATLRQHDRAAGSSSKYSYAALGRVWKRTS